MMQGLKYTFTEILKPECQAFDCKLVINEGPGATEFRVVYTWTGRVDVDERRFEASTNVGQLCDSILQELRALLQQSPRAVQERLKADLQVLEDALS